MELEKTSQSMLLLSMASSAVQQLILFLEHVYNETHIIKHISA